MKQEFNLFQIVPTIDVNVDTDRVLIQNFSIEKRENYFFVKIFILDVDHNFRWKINESKAKKGQAFIDTDSGRDAFCYMDPFYNEDALYEDYITLLLQAGEIEIEKEIKVTRREDGSFEFQDTDIETLGIFDILPIKKIRQALIDLFNLYI